MNNKHSRSLKAWVLYDFANSAFATTVMAGFFPILFKEYWAKGVEVTVSTAILGYFNSLSTALVIISAPFLGILADLRNKKKLFLIIATFLGCIGTAFLAFVAEGKYFQAAAIYAFSVTAFTIACSLYDSLLDIVADRKTADRASSMGYAFGYLGGGLLFAFNVLMYRSPQTFGFESGIAAVLAAFLSVAAWWALFSLPLFICVSEHRGIDSPLKFSEVKSQFSRLFHSVVSSPGLKFFLLAYWFYIDGVNTVIKMAVDYGVAIGFKPADLIVALLLTQFVGFPSALVFSRLSAKLGNLNAIKIGLLTYTVIIIWAANMQERWEFFALAALIGAVQGGVQALSRSYFLGLIPAGSSGEYFGLFNIVGKFAALFGPMLVATVTLLTDNSRLGIISLLVFFIGGLIFLNKSNKVLVR